jgi:PAS domain S-box-containing protein
MDGVDDLKSKILIVEDESIEALSFEQSLKSFDYEVVGIASSGEDALEKVAELKPDLVLMDIVLKGEMDGIEVASKINEKFDIPVVYLTAHPENSTLERAKLTLPYGYIIKPANRTDLKNTIGLAIYKHRMERKLKINKERYLSILENVQDAYICADEKGKIIIASPSAVKMYGFHSINEMIGTNTVSMYKNPEDRESVLKQLKEGGGIYDFQGEGQKKDGSSFWASMNVQYKYDDDGQILGTEAFIRDITEHKSSDERIKRLYRLYNTLSQINQSVVRIKDKNELFKNICQICVEYGKFRMAWIGLIDQKTGLLQPVAHHGHDDGYLKKIILNVHEKPNPKKATSVAIHKGEVVVNEDIKRAFYRLWQDEALKRGYRSLASIPLKLKEEVIGNLNIYASEPDFFTEDEINLAEEIGTDISYALNSIESEKELKNVNKALFESERNYRELVDHSMVAIYKTNLKGDIIFANDAMVRIFDYRTLKELKAINAADLYANSEDRAKIIEKLQKEGSFSQYEVEMKSSTGETVHIILSANLMGDTISGMMMDITQRKNAEKVLKENEERFRALITNSNDIIRILDQDGKIIFDSPSSQRILGYGEGFFIGKSPLDYIHPDDQSRVKSDLNKVFEDKNPGTPTEFRILKSDGTYIPVETIGQNLTDVPGVDGVVITTHPLTDRKLVEKALRESERLLTDIIDFLPDATFAINREGKVIAWNRAVEKMTGTLKEDMMNKGNYEYAIPWYGKRRPILIDLIKERNSVYSFEYDFIKDAGQTLTAEVFVPSVYEGKGAYLWVLASPLLDSNGEYYGAIESVRDITDRKNYEFALQRTEERFRAVAESAVDAIITTDVNGEVLFCNDSVKTIFGYKRKEIIGKNLTVLMPDRLKKDYINGLDGFKSSGEHMRVGKTLKTVGLRKDGIEFPFEMSLASWSSGDKNYFTSIIRDITDSEKAKTQIVESLNEKEILIKEIHHRVKNNLQIISSLLDLQENYVKEDETAVNVLKESQNRVLSMAMIHEMLYQSKDLSNINFADYLRSLVSSLFHTYGVTGRINMVINVDNVYLNVETSVPLGLITSELLSNSLKYAFPEDRKGEIVLSIISHKTDFELVISDNGIGFPEDVDFKNVESSLGLQLVNSLVNQLDGTIKLDRTNGTEFTIKFKELKYQERV